jgi:hypothetical protein
MQKKRKEYIGFGIWISSITYVLFVSMLYSYNEFPDTLDWMFICL